VSLYLLALPLVAALLATSRVESKLRQSIGLMDYLPQFLPQYLPQLWTIIGMENMQFTPVAVIVDSRGKAIVRSVHTTVTSKQRDQVDKGRSTFDYLSNS
jgi:hypothetical protein